MCLGSIVLFVHHKVYDVTITSRTIRILLDLEHYGYYSIVAMTGRNV